MRWRDRFLFCAEAIYKSHAQGFVYILSGGLKQIQLLRTVSLLNHGSSARTRYLRLRRLWSREHFEVWGCDPMQRVWVPYSLQEAYP
jgi:hypothetical protein